MKIGGGQYGAAPRGLHPEEGEYGGWCIHAAAGSSSRVMNMGGVHPGGSSMLQEGVHPGSTFPL